MKALFAVSLGVAFLGTVAWFGQHNAACLLVTIKAAQQNPDAEGSAVPSPTTEQSDSNKTPPIDETQNNWIRERAANFLSCTPDTPLSDDERSVVDRIVGDAQVVAIGEAIHGSKPNIQSIERILRYLIEERQADMVVLEAGFAATLTLNRYVVLGEGEAQEATVATGGWNYANQETLEFVNWLRNYNRTPAAANRPVRVFGCDVQSLDGPKAELVRLLQAFKRIVPFSTEYIEDTVARIQAIPADHQLNGIRESAMREFQSENPNEARLAEIQLQMSEFARTASASLVKISNRLKEMQRELPDTIASDERFLFKQCHRSLEQAIESWSPEGFDKRDLFMAENVSALKEHFKPARMLLLAHNLHLARVLPGEQLGTGYYLAKQYGTNYRVIGSAFYEGQYLALAQYRPEDDLVETADTPRPDTFESILRRIAEDRQTNGLLLNLSDRETQESDDPWKDGVEMRIGAAGRKMAYEACFTKQKPQLQYDGMIFFQKSSPIKVLPGFYQHMIKQWKPNNLDIK